MDPTTSREVAAAIGQIPSGLFILTARTDEKRSGMLASWVQQVCFKPPMVSVAVAKGRSIMPLISDSLQFGLCQLRDGETRIMRRFTSGVDSGDDPLLGLELVPDTVTGVPILANMLAYLECQMVNHIDVEGDHNLIVGRIVGGRYFGGSPAVRVRKDGLKY